MLSILKNNIDFLFCNCLFISVLFVSFMELLEVNLRVILLVISIILAIIRIYKIITKKEE